MESITLSDGREIPIISFAIATSGHMFIRVAMNMGEAFQTFSSGTDKIIYNQGDGERIMISGFTSLEYIVNEQDCVRVALMRPLDVEEVHIND